VLFGTRTIKRDKNPCPWHFLLFEEWEEQSRGGKNKHSE
jgi:hypothetical protein